MDRLDSSTAVEQRRQYVTAFNSTMFKIWKEQILRLGILDTGKLYNSVSLRIPVMNDKVTELFLSWDFVEYGVFVDRGTGREVPLGNPGDIGHGKVRQPRPWLSKKFYSSFFNLRDFFADNIGREFCAAIPYILGSNKF